MVARNDNETTFMSFAIDRRSLISVPWFFILTPFADLDTNHRDNPPTSTNRSGREAMMERPSDVGTEPMSAYCASSNTPSKRAGSGFLLTQ